MKYSKLDTLKKQKANQRIQTEKVMIIAVIGILLVALVLIWLSFSFVDPLVYATPVALANQSAVPSNVIDNAAQTFIPFATLTPSQMNFSSLSNERLANMSLAQKTGQMILMGLEGEELTITDCEIIQQVMPGGIVFHGGNVSNLEQLRRLISDLKTCSAQASQIPLFFALDHEGQYINRFESDVTIFPSAQALGATDNPTYAFYVAFYSGQELASAGINMVLGPDADVLMNYDNTVIGERSYGDDPKHVGQFVASAVQGYRQAGLIPVLKHFPGHGGTSTDSHEKLPVDNATLELLSKSYFPPFSQGLEAGSPSVMVGHIALPQIDPTYMPASLSAPIITLLRGQVGFDGVIMTDSLDMGALQTTGLDSPGVALTSVKAGVDILLILSPSEAQMASSRIQQSIEQSELSLEQINNSVLRILKMKEQNNLLNGYPAPAQPDWQVNQALADDVGRNSVALLKNANGLIPIPKNMMKILIVAPPDEWGLDDVLDNALRTSGFTPVFIHYPGPWQGVEGNDAMIQDIAVEAANADLTLILTWQAHANNVIYGDNWQSRLVMATQEYSSRLVVVSLKSPTDILEFPNISTFIVTFGTTRGQIQALADILTGSMTAGGRNPLLQLP
jgi:beta-N-acetylhexosaminidase